MNIKIVLITLGLLLVTGCQAFSTLQPFVRSRYSLRLRFKVANESNNKNDETASTIKPDMELSTEVPIKLQQKIFRTTTDYDYYGNGETEELDNK